MNRLYLRFLITRLTGNSDRIKAISTFFLLILLSFFNYSVFGAVTVTGASGGTLICSNKALGGTAAGYTTLNTITISEGATSDLYGTTSGAVTDVLVLNAPPGWQFGTTLPTFSFASGANVTSITGSITAATLTINIVVNNTTSSDQISITGLQVQATSTSAIAGYIYASTVSGISGITTGASGSNFGNLSLTPMITPSLTIAATPSGAVCPGVNVVFLPTPTNGGSTPIYQWYLNGATIATGSSYANSSLVTGNTVSCVMTSSAACVSPATATSNTITMTVNPAPAAITGTTSTCPGLTTSLSDVTASGIWSSTNTSVATIDASGNVTGVAAGTSTISYMGAICPATTTLYVNLPPTAPVLIPGTVTICNGGSVAMTTSATPLSSSILSQNFNSGVAPWTVDNSGSVGTLAGSGFKACIDGYTNEQGIYHSPDNTTFVMANSDTSGSASYTSSKLISPSFSLAGYSSATLTFQQSYAYWSAGDFNVNLDISTNGGATWTTLKNFVGSNIGTLTSFITQTFSLNAYLGQPNVMIRFYYYCHWGYYWAIDNVAITGISSVAVPTWSPSTYLYTDAALSTPYTTGTTANTVYVHPTSVTSATSINYTATATIPGCSATGNGNVTINPTPAAIAGSNNVCVGSSTTLSNSVSGGVWSSSSPSIASIGSSGIVSGLAAGTAIISYTLGTGCAATAIITVNTTPVAITGANTVCLNATTTLNNALGGGTWSSSNTLVATVGSSSGIVAGAATGTATITYSLGLGCTSSKTITVNPLPAAITGAASVCMGLTTTLADGGGGTWSSSNTSIASVSAGTGIVTGVSGNTAVITYTISTGCYVTSVVTVNPLFSITGTAQVCQGLITTLGNAATGGTWSSSNMSVATVGSSSGIVLGIIPGTAVISYVLPTGCTATAVVTVNSLPSSITGTTSVCAGLTTTLNDASGSGTWSSSNISVATVGSASGIVNGVAAGTAVITYTIATGCISTATVTVNPLPAAISGAMNICQGLTATLTDAPGGGTWISSYVAIASIGTSSGVVNGIATGTSLITYTLPTGCLITGVVTVNSLPAAITGINTVCAGSMTTLADASSDGAWGSSNTGVATIISGTGVVTGVSAGIATITYMLTTGCIATYAVTVNSLPASITGTQNVCVGLSTTLNDITNTGSWSSGSASIASVGSGTGIVNGVAAGTVNITYTLPTGCIAYRNVTVNPLPAAITGTTTICQGLTTTLNDASGGGSWSSNTITVATVGSGSGIVTGMASGSTYITYTLPTGCIATAVVSVNPLPAAITGTTNVCMGLTTTLNDATGSGTWSSSNTSIATTGPASGIVTGMSANTVTITYTLATGCIASTSFTVNPLPVAISGAGSLCIGATTTLNDATGSGTWSSSNAAVATIGTTSGIVNGITAGTSTITYTLLTGCIATRTITVNPLPASIAGSTNICMGAISSLSDANTGGTWLSSNTSIATVGSATGAVYGVLAGVANITYTLSTGCTTNTSVTVYPSPSAISGTLAICAGNTTTLGNTSPGGTWASSDAIIASIGTTSGIVNGASAGTATITYALASGCAATAVMTINIIPAAISGAGSVCQGYTTSLSDINTGGSWTSSNTTVANIGLSTGVVTGYITGTATITYTLSTGCSTSGIISVNPLPSSVTGTAGMCAGATTTLSDVSTGGTWSSSNTSIATVGSSTGIVTGAASGITTVIYTLPTGCAATKVVTINTTPAAIAGIESVCQGMTTTLSDAIGTGTWSSNNTAVATVGSGTGIVTGGASGTVNIIYTLPSGCSALATVTVNGLPSVITGAGSVCMGYTITLGDATSGGVWSSSNTSVATIGSINGVVIGVAPGTATITYMLGAGCSVTTTITVNAIPTAITGTTLICTGSSVTLSNGVAGGVWGSSNGAVATVVSATGVINGISAGTTIITYTLGTGCTVTTTVTVNTLTSITGTTSICQGSSITLSNSSPGGTWSSSNNSIATVGSATGAVLGSATGGAIITYTLSAGCITSTPVTVTIAPASISGNSNVCVGLTISLADATPGGSWSSSNTTIATVGSGTGIVYGASDGGTSIVYTLPTGCAATKPIAVSLVPSAIAGTLAVCQGLTTTLSDPNAGGTWSSSNTTIAIVGSSTGVVSGMSAGTATITYTLGAGCTTTAVITINPIPPAISGSLAVCQGLTGTLADAFSGGTWVSNNTSVATVGSATGVISGVVAGTSLITYTATTGCMITGIATVNNTAAITGGTIACAGATTTLVDATSGGTWSSNNTFVAAVGSTSGIMTGVASGMAVISYVAPTGCLATATITVNPLPSVITGTTSVCLGLTKTLNDATTGGTWSGSNSAIASIGPSGILTGVAQGNAIITYQLSTGCFTTTPVTVNPLPATITGYTALCIGLTTSLSDATTGGTWSSGNTATATVGTGTGVVYGVVEGTSTITYTSTVGCINTTVVTVNTLMPITGTAAVCAGSTTTLSNGATGGTWSSSNTAIATVDASAGIVTGITAGTSVVTYTYGTGCWATAIITVNPLPSNIGGTTNVCAGLTTTLNDTLSGGTWSSNNTAIATIVPATGIATGVAAGTTIITYTLPTGCINVAFITVNPLPAAIAGINNVCVGLASTLSDTSAGGTWSSSNASIATINAATGILTGVSAGTNIITYTLPTGCITTTPVTVNPLPASITGAMAICNGFSTTLSDATLGGTWSSTGTSSVLTIDAATRIVLSVGAGTATITYTLPTGCINTTVVTVNPLPASIIGASVVCQGLSVTLHNATMGGVWSSSNTSIATVDLLSGSVTGMVPGVAIITYTLPTGCLVAKYITVNPLPANIAGPASVCMGSVITLSDATAGGAWSSSGTGIATISSGGVISPVSAGVAPVTYSLPTGCIAVTNVTVNQLPATITGVLSVCSGLTTSLNDTTSGGVWSSGGYSATAIVGAGTGIVSGIAVGSAIITYTLPTGCLTTTTVSVFSSPLPVTGAAAVCAGSAITLSDATGGGSWSSGNVSSANVNYITGVASGVAAGTTTITYALTSGCISTAVVTVNPLPSYIEGLTSVCIGLTTTLSDSTAGGIWNSTLFTGNATIGSSTGIVTGLSSGTVGITYTLPTGCLWGTTVTVNPLPLAITGVTHVCTGFSTTLADAVSGGYWSSGATGIATVSAAGVVTGVTAGIVPITYMLASGCMVTTTVTVNPLPSAIAGPVNACLGEVTVLSNATAGGTWASSNTLRAVIGSSTGIVTGISLGAAVITYTLPTGCWSAYAITVNPLPAAITGASAVCQGNATLLNDATAGGTWASSNTLIVSAGSVTGYISGISAGTVTITYTLATGCTASRSLTVNPLSAITGISNICVSSTEIFNDVVPGGLWHSSTTPVATVDSITGAVHAIGPGTAIISYTLGTGCMATMTITVNQLPGNYLVTGGGAYCSGTAGPHIGLNGSTIGIIYQLYRDTVGVTTITGTGAALDLGSYTTPGNYIVIAYNTATGCIKRMTDSAVISFIPFTAPSVSILSSGGDTVCTAVYNTFTAVALYGGASPSYEWKVNNISMGTGMTLSYIPADGDSISCQLISSAVCLALDTANTSFIISVAPVVMPSLSIVASPGEVICAHTPVLFTANPIYGGAAPVYSWYVNGMNTGGGSTYSYTPANGDVIYCNLISNYHCTLIDSVLSNADTMMVNAALTPSVTINATPGLSIEAGEQDTLTAMVTGGGTSTTYQWLLNGVPITGATSSVLISNTFINNDSVKCVVTSSGSCGGYIDTAIVTLSVNNLGISTTQAATSIKLLPNPNMGEFNVTGQLSLSADQNVSLTITDVTGQTIYSKDVLCRQGKINEHFSLDANTANGIYLLNLNAQGQHITIHFVIAR